MCNNVNYVEIRATTEACLGLRTLCKCMFYCFSMVCMSRKEKLGKAFSFTKHLKMFEIHIFNVFFKCDLMRVSISEGI